MHYALFRYPLMFSYSPLIHQLMGQQFGLEIQYTQIETPLQTLKTAIYQFRQQGGKGANVTMPLKEEAYSICTQLTPRSTLAQSVNTLFWRGNTLWGDTTDGIGLVRDITINHQQSLANKNILILGAGGAVAGIIGSILEEHPQSVSVFNRTITRTQALAERFPIQSVTLETVNQVGAFDWILNATPLTAAAELTASLNPTIFQNAFFYELTYPKMGTHNIFAEFARSQGAAQVYHGLGMLVEQAAESFAIWHEGLQPQTRKIITLLAQKIGN